MWRGHYGKQGAEAVRVSGLPGADKREILLSASAEGNETNRRSRLEKMVFFKKMERAEQAPSFAGTVLPGMRKKRRKDARDGG